MTRGDATAGGPLQDPAPATAGAGIGFLAGSLVLLASLTNFLRFQHYPLLRPEVALVLIVIFAVPLLVALAYRGQRLWVQAVLEGILVGLAIELSQGKTVYVVLAAGAVAAIVLFRRRTLLPVIATMAFFSFVLALFGVGQPSEVQNATAQRAAPARGGLASADRPALLHLILDEHSGVEGLPKDTPEGLAMKQALMRFYLDRGFRLFGRAYSEHMHTVNSIPHILSLGTRREPSHQLTMTGGALKRNPYFSLLRAQGYRVNVIQSDFIDYCKHSGIASCRTYSSSSLRRIPHSSLTTAEKAKLVLVRFTLLSKTFKTASAVYDVLAVKLGRVGVPLPLYSVDMAWRTSSINAIGAFDGLIEQLRHAQPGNAYFAHLLVPHYPYSVSARCSTKPLGQWEVRRSMTPRPLREAAYFDQLRCTISKVGAALSAIEASPAGGNLVVVVHGDHGSRITMVEPTDSNIGRIPDRDLASGFSTLFAVRSPVIDGGYIADPATAAALLSQFSRSGFRSPPVPAGTMPPVILDDAAWVPRRAVRMPSSW